jgi:hypothetical protein
MSDGSVSPLMMSLLHSLVPGFQGNKPPEGFTSRDQAGRSTSPELKTDQSQIATSAATSFPLATFTSGGTVQAYGGTDLTKGQVDTGFSAHTIAPIQPTGHSGSIAVDKPKEDLGSDVQRAVDVALGPSTGGRSLDPTSGGGTSVTVDRGRDLSNGGLAVDKGISLDAPRPGLSLSPETPISARTLTPDHAPVRDLSTEMAAGSARPVILTPDTAPVRDLSLEGSATRSEPRVLQADTAPVRDLSLEVGPKDASPRSLTPDTTPVRDLSTEFNAKGSGSGTIQVDAPKARDLEQEAKLNDLSANDPTKGKAQATDDLANVPDHIKHFLDAARIDGKPLTDDQKQVLERFYMTATKNATPEQARQVDKDLYSLFDLVRFRSGKALVKADQFGQNMLDYLKQFNGSDLSPKVPGDKSEVARDILANITRSVVSQGDNTLDCGEATLQQMLGNDHPADFARVAVGLATKGEAKIPGEAPGPQPDTLKLPDLNPSDRAGRDPLSFAIQKSFENYAGTTAQDGLTGKQAEHLYNAVLGADFVTISRESFMANAANILSTGGALLSNVMNAPELQGGVKATVKADGIYHSVEVTRFAFPNIEYFDPQLGKRLQMPVFEFYQDLVRVTLPRSILVDNGQDPNVLTGQEGGGRFGGFGKRG